VRLFRRGRLYLCLFTDFFQKLTTSLKLNKGEYKMAKLAQKIRPLGDRVLIAPAEMKDVTKGGIIIPDSAKEKPMEGKVIAIGKKRDEDGKEIPFDVQVGDTVLLPKYGGTEIKIDDVIYQLVREDDLLGVLV
jgi:chaperonin GroES